MHTLTFTPLLDSRSSVLSMNPKLDQSEIQARIHRVIIDKTVSRTQQELADMSGIQSSMMSKMLSGREIISRKHLVQIERATSVRLDWLQYGIEPMYWEPGEEPERSESEHYEGVLLRDYLKRIGIEYADFGRRIGKKKNTVQGYFKTEKFSNANRAAILKALHATYEEVFGFAARNTTGLTNVRSASLIREVGNFSAEPMIVLPFVPIRGRAGTPTTQYWRQTIPTTRIMRAALNDFEVDPLNPKRSWWVIEVGGDSMEPQLRTHARILGYYVGRKNKEGIFEIDRDQLRTLNPGIWAIQYNDEFVIKRIRANRIEEEGGLTAHSDNPPPDPFFIRADSIYHVWVVKTVIESHVH